MLWSDEVMNAGVDVVSKAWVYFRRQSTSYIRWFKNQTNEFYKLHS